MNNIPPVTMEFQTIQYTQRSLDTSTRQGGKYFMAGFAFFDWSLHLILLFFLSKVSTGSGMITVVTLTSCLTNQRTWSQGFSTTTDTHMHKICARHICATQWSSSVMSDSFKHGPGLVCLNLLKRYREQSLGIFKQNETFCCCPHTSF